MLPKVDALRLECGKKEGERMEREWTKMQKRKVYLSMEIEIDDDGYKGKKVIFISYDF